MGVGARTPLVGPQFADDLPSKAEIFEYWKGRLRGLGCRIDWAEPGCWACGFRYGTRYDVKGSQAGWDKVLRCWNSIPLQRCHIVARSLGGTNDISNLFLMCRECHDLAPNTSFPEIFFEWASAQSWDARESAKLSAAFDAFGVSGVALEDFAEV
ncbi:HNH endonuclease [Bradyrhizobium sp. LjRoot220]|uniref:HNH endonuclease n=1 Tax=Bradyrhizobium sp. LjRoot220 TaxID=3342284 RepID=UPI003F50349D